MDVKKDFQKTTKTYFDQEAETYDASRDGKFVKCMYGEIVDRVEALPGNYILDLGCGNGNIISLLKKRKKASYYGVDLSEQMIREAKKRVGRDVILKTADAMNLPFQDEMFDIVICNASFHHYTRPLTAVKEIKRVLKPGGTLVLGDPTCPALLRKLLNWGLHLGPSGDFRIYGKKDILPLFSENGFLVQNWKRLNYRSFVFHATKQE